MILHRFTGNVGCAVPTLVAEPWIRAESLSAGAMTCDATSLPEDHVLADVSEEDSSQKASDAAGAASPEDLAFALRTLAETLKPQSVPQKQIVNK